MNKKMSIMSEHLSGLQNTVFALEESLIEKSAQCEQQDDLLH